MKRDMDLVRKILLEMENAPSDGPDEMVVPDYDEVTVMYHIKIMTEAGLIEAVDASTMNHMLFFPTNLTWEGHEFLDAARNPSVWQKTIDLVTSKGGGVAFAILKEVLIQEAKQHFLGSVAN